MNFKPIATTALVASLAFSPISPMVRPALADAGDAIAGALIGGIIGHAIAKDQQKRRYYSTKRSSKSSKSTSGISSAQREQNREVQYALNHFGYPVGSPDGSIGPKSRSAISTYQAFLGYPATGQLTEYERTVLVTAYQRALAGGPAIAQTISTSPYGMKGLLLSQRDEMAGVSTVAPAPGVMAQAPVAVAPLPTAPVAVVPGAAAVAGTAVAAAALPSLLPEAAPEDASQATTAALPSFMGATGAQGSLASHCNKVSLLTNTNGGYATAETLTDANFALSEQFCLARTYAMASGEEMAAKVAGFTPAQISEQCQAFGPVLKDHVSALSLKPMAEVLSGVQGFVLQSGMAPAQLSGTAKVCLGVGYTTDDMDVAVGSALLLTALGEAAYGELLGHHLSQGYGANLRPDLALAWYEAALGSGSAVFAPGLAGRNEVIRKAAFTLNGRVDAVQPEAPVQEAALPQFSVDPAPAAAPVAPEAAPSDVATLVAPEPVAEAAAETAAPTATSDVMAAGAGVAIMAARLPLMLLGQN